MIEFSLINMLGIAIISNMWTHWFTPIQNIKNKIGDFLSRSLAIVSPFFSCSKCVGFWSGLLFFHSLPEAALTSFIAFLINHIIDRVESWYGI